MTIFFKIAVVLSMLLSLMSCGDNGGGDNNTTTGTPTTISDLLFPSDTASSTFGPPGSDLPFVGQMNFKDPDGDVKTLRVIIKDGGTEISSTDTDITNDAAALTEGNLQVTANIPASSLPVTFTADVLFTIEVLVIDGGNNRSNPLSKTVTVTP